MFFQILFANPAVAIVWLVVIFLSLTVHEFSHALMGKWRGDKTAELQGRLTLNPLAHLDPLGLIPLLLFGFGWAKPVPYNPYNLKNPRWDSVLVALAGPAANFLMATLAAVILRFLLGYHLITSLNLLIVFLFLSIVLNLLLLFFNLVPVHPLDGSKLLFAIFEKPRYAQFRELIAVRGPQVLLVLVYPA